VPAVSLAGDRVGEELVQRPTHWSMPRIRNFTIVFGLLSTLFDVLTFIALLRLGEGMADPFHTGWFLESLATEVLVLFVIRTPRPLFRSRPGALMTWTSIAVLVAAVAATRGGMARWLGFVPLPGTTLAVLAGITVAYAATVELLKSRLYRVGEARAGESATC
jgi:Mg2+-importing ATPase